MRIRSHVDTCLTCSVSFPEIMFESFNIPGLYIAVQVNIVVKYESRDYKIPLLVSFILITNILELIVNQTDSTYHNLESLKNCWYKINFTYL